MVDTDERDPEEVFYEALDKYAADIESVSSLEQSDSQVQLLNETVRELNLSQINKAEEVSKLKKELENLKRKHNEKSDALQDAMEKLGNFSVKQTNRKIKRGKASNAKLKEKEKEKLKEVKEIQK